MARWQHTGGYRRARDSHIKELAASRISVYKAPYYDPSFLVFCGTASAFVAWLAEVIIDQLG